MKYSPYVELDEAGINPFDPMCGVRSAGAIAAAFVSRFAPQHFEADRPEILTPMDPAMHPDEVPF